jgi:hypothetical protein
MVQPGHEFLIGAVQDRELGTVLIVGKGGAGAESAAGAIFSLLPVDPCTLYRSLASSPLVEDVHRHNDTIDIDALVQVVVKVGEFLQDNEQYVVELDLNPVIVGRARLGAAVVDALLILDIPEMRRAGPVSQAKREISNLSRSTDAIQ